MKCVQRGGSEVMADAMQYRDSPLILRLANELRRGWRRVDMKSLAVLQRGQTAREPMRLRMQRDAGGEERDEACDRPRQEALSDGCAADETD
ncbi:hypothetical protein SKAU_G00350670 [Synaphobranchus kaupii]|uniref:Uncharacterized protein n=1 Tax=Synaphobranchus kaupii TaxID=118154 RepID=A0A9Q1EKH2_SYNKA|nr:hypothetical protein SKAU_G00350670 [Synaphobranchus kaupii]